MRSAARAIVWLACSLAFACGDGGALTGDESDLRDAEEEGAADERVPSSPGQSNEAPAAQDELTVDDLACPHGGMVGKVKVSFACGEITTVSCKDLSNVVVEFADGSRQRFEGLKGQSGTFRGTGANAGEVITRVWVKAGANHSGDGPGYGERFDAPKQSCDVPACVGTSCNPPPPPPPVEDCFVADGTCNPPPPPPPPEEECFVADGSCIPRDNTPPPPPPKGDRSYL
jgi:hypothetical protein